MKKAVYWDFNHFIIDNIVVITVILWFHFLKTFCNLNQTPPEVQANAAETLCAITRNAPSTLATKLSSPGFVIFAFIFVFH